MRTKLKKALVAMTVLATGLGAITNAATLSLTGMTETGADKALSNSYFYTGCYAPVKININPEGVETTSVDAKLFMTGTFVFQSNTGSYTGFTEGVFTEYQIFGNSEADDRIGTGTAQNGDYAGWEYKYINARTDSATPVSGNTEQNLAIIYLKPNVTNTTGLLDIYYLGANVNSDDSNISSGISNNTQYVDALNNIAGTGEFTFVNDYACPYKPYIIEWAKYYSILGHDLPDGVVGKDSSVFENLDGFDVFTTATQYSGTIISKAGPNIVTGDYTTDSSWDIWTKEPIVVKLSGNSYQVNGVTTSDIKLVEDVFNSPYISLSGANDWTAEKTIIITGNVETGISFFNRIGNQAEKYQSGTNNYYDNFLLDVFRYDTTATPVVATSVASGDGYEYIALSGLASTGPSNETSGWHANFTTDDDKFRIIKFSGYNTTDYGQPTTTSYNDDLNNLYVRGDSQAFTMQKTGLIDNTDPQNPIATSTGAIMFTETWSGYIYYSDIAGNVSGVFVSVNIAPKVTFEVKVSPAFRDETNNLSTTGDFWLAYKDNGEWTFTHNSVMDGDPQLAINENGTGSIDVVVPATGLEYLVVFKGSGMLSVGITGIWTNDISDTGTNYFDLSGNVHTRGTTYIYPTEANFGSTYFEIGGDVAASTSGQYDYINAGDLTDINTNLTVGVFNNDLLYMDFNLNSVISAIEQAIVIQYNAQGGWINEKGDGVNYPAKSGFNLLP